MKKIFGALVACLISSAAFGQAQLGPGHVWGNSTAAKAPPQDATVTAILDRALGSTRGALVERGSSGWGLLTPSATARVPYLSGGTGADPLYGAYTLPASVISGGVACFTSTTAQGSSVLLTLNGLLLGGGAGSCPTPMASLGTTTTLLHGNAGGSPTFSAVSLTADVSGQLPFGNGGCNGTTQQSCFDNAGPTATRAGDIIYWNGTHYVTLAGNNSGTNVLTENASGVPSWAAPGTGTVTSVTCGTGLSGGTFTTTGTCAVSITSITNSLGADVPLNNTANYFDGPSVAQGVTGTWFAAGSVTVQSGSVGVDAIFCKLWDGTTVISSLRSDTGGANLFTNLSLSGALSSPAGNIRISCRDSTQTTGGLRANATGNSKDSTITAIRIQ